MKRIQSILFLLVLSALALPAQATNITVDTAIDELNNDGDCSLREAIEAANTNSAVDNCPAGEAMVFDSILLFSISDHFVLNPALGPIVISEQVGLLGATSATTVIRQESTMQLFSVDMTDPTHSVEFRDLTLKDGYAAPGTQGGAVELREGEYFVFNKVNFIHNSSEVGDFETWGGGGAIFAGPLLNSVDPVLELNDCLFEGNGIVDASGSNDGFGGAINSQLRSDGPTVVNEPLDQILIRRSEFNDNSSVRSGSAIYSLGVRTLNVVDSQFVGNSINSGSSTTLSTISVNGATGPERLDILRSTFVSNTAGSTTVGSAVSMNDVESSIVNSTFTGHLDTPVDYRNGAIGTIQWSTLVNNGGENTSDSALKVCDGCDVSVRASIVWNNWPTDNLCDIDENAGFSSLGFNIDSDGSCTDHVDDLPMTDPGLLQLDAWGDDFAHFDLLTFLPYGAALDAANLNDCPGPFGGNITSDARGEPKPVDGSETGMNLCDIGAVEYQFDEDPVVNRLNLTINGSGSGRVFSANYENFECTESCTGFFAEFSQVRLTVDPEPGSEFTGWDGACSGTGLCIVSMSLNRSVTATFALLSTNFELGVILDGNGTGTVSSNPAGISCPGQCEAAFSASTLVTLSATPGAGQTFQGWSGACTGTATCQVTMNQARTVRAIFLDADTLYIGGFE